MPDTHEHMLDHALSKLLEGVPLTTLVSEYPDISAELEAHASLMGGLRTLQSDMPSDRGLYAALSSARLAAQSSHTPSPYLSFFMTYRTAFVLPVLVLVLVGAGYLIRPGASRDSDLPIMPTQNSGAQTGHVPDAATMQTGNATQESAADTGIAPASFKSQGDARMMLMTAPAPETEGTSTATSTPATSTQP